MRALKSSLVSLTRNLSWVVVAAQLEARSVPPSIFNSSSNNNSYHAQHNIPTNSALFLNKIMSPAGAMLL